MPKKLAEQAVGEELETGVAADEQEPTTAAGTDQHEADDAGDSPAPATESPEREAEPAVDEGEEAGGEDGDASKATTASGGGGHEETSIPAAEKSPRRFYPTHTAGRPTGSPAKSGREVTEFKAGPFVVKSIEGRTVTGIFSVFGVLDTQWDIIHPGAFLKTIRERGDRAFHMWQHDFWNPPTAVIRELREIGVEELPDSIRAEWPEATGGVLVKREYLDTLRGNEILTALKAGAPLQMSFGYDPVRYDFEEVEDLGRIRHLREVRLWETSDVLWGANSATVANTAALSVPFETLLLQLEQHVNAMAGAGAGKEGRRSAAADQERINTIARLVVELGADNVKLAGDGDTDPDKADLSGPAGRQGPVDTSDTPTEEQRRAGADDGPPLTLLATELSLLELETFV